MPFVAAIVASVLIALLRGGRPAELTRLHFRQPWLLGIGLALWIVTGPLPLQSWLGISTVASDILFVGHVALLLFIWQNRQIPWLLIAGLGLAANSIVMLANGGQMPVDQALLGALGLQEEAQRLLQQGLWLHISVITPETKLPFLGDVLFLGPPFPWPRVLSAGDVLLAIAAFLVVQSAMVRPLRLRTIADPQLR